MTRDPERIDDVLDELEQYWKEHPDLRLAQVVVNIHQDTRRAGQKSDPFYMEDDVVLDWLENQND